ASASGSPSRASPSRSTSCAGESRRPLPTVSGTAACPAEPRTSLRGPGGARRHVLLESHKELLKAFSPQIGHVSSGPHLVPDTRGCPEWTAVKVLVAGAGSWGTAFARLLADRGHAVTLACRDPAQARTIAETGRNPRYLRDVD